MASRRCLTCRALIPKGTRCFTCQRTHDATRRPSPAARGYTAEYRANRKTLLAGNPSCVWCGAPATTADHHPIPAHLGGPATLDNLVPACKPCNSGRNNTR